MREWLKRLRTRSRRKFDFPDMRAFQFPNQLKVYLIGFSYDSLTAQMVSWLSNILVSRKINQQRIVRFNNNTGTTRQELTEALQDEGPRVELFCGHGLSTGLLGPPQGQIAGSILSDPSRVIYDIQMITDTPSAMFAFCCHAGDRFGRAFTALKDKQFLGFKGEIPFPLEKYDDLKYAFQSVARSIIQEGRITENHRQMFLDRLNKISSEISTYENPTLLEMWLDEYKKHLATYV